MIWNPEKQWKGKSATNVVFIFINQDENCNYIQ